MGFSLKSWVGRATRLPKSIKKIKLGDDIKAAGKEIFGKIASDISGSGSVQDTRAQVNAAQNPKNYIPLAIGIVVVLAIVVYFKKRG